MRSPPLLRAHAPTTSLPPRYAEEGASISISRVQATGFKGRDSLQEREEGMPHAHGGLWPILSWDAESIRQGGRIKQQQGTPDAVSSNLVSLSLPHNTWHGSKKCRARGLAHAACPVIRYDLYFLSSL